MILWSIFHCLVRDSHRMVWLSISSVFPECSGHSKKEKLEIFSVPVIGKSGKGILRRVPEALRDLNFLSSWSTPGTLFFEFLERSRNSKNECLERFGNSKTQKVPGVFWVFELPERSRYSFFEFLERSGYSLFEFLERSGNSKNRVPGALQELYFLSSRRIPLPDFPTTSTCITPGTRVLNTWSSQGNPFLELPERSRDITGAFQALMIDFFIMLRAL